jgi:hypothetical protein
VRKHLARDDSDHALPRGYEMVEEMKAAQSWMRRELYLAREEHSDATGHRESLDVLFWRC